MSFPWTAKEIQERTSEAVSSFWAIRGKQAATQKAKGKVQDAGTRSEVTGGKHLDAFRDMFVAIAKEAGFKDSKVSTGEFGLLVALGAFTTQAVRFAKSKSNLRLIDGDELVNLVFEHYDQFDSRYKSLIPLRRVYVPEAVGTESE